MKLLLVSPFKFDKNLYPHLLDFYNDLNEKGYIVDYLYYPERGYWIDIIYSELLRFKNILANIKRIIRIIVADIKLIKLKNEYDHIITIDNYIYCKACTYLNKKVILWSHDFVSKDQEKSKKRIFRKIARKTNNFLLKNKKIIIQDKNRLKAFCESISHSSKNDFIVFFLPVSLNQIDNALEVKSISNPIIMQIGGINQYRSNSISLLKEYQNSNFELIFHGFFDNEMIDQLNNSNKIPILSSVPLAGNILYKLIEKCDIGFIHYQGNDNNFYFIDHASGQLVEFLRLGKPLIISGNSNLSEFIVIKKIGIYIDDTSKVNEAINKIMDHYSEYSRNAIELFYNEYNLKIIMNKFHIWLENYVV